MEPMKFRYRLAYDHDNDMELIHGWLQPGLQVKRRRVAKAAYLHGLFIFAIFQLARCSN